MNKHMLTRDQIAAAMQDRILLSVTKATGLTAPTLMKLRDNVGNVSRSTQQQISGYLMEKPAKD